MRPVRGLLKTEYNITMTFYYTYVLWSLKDKKFYTGWTVDLQSRFAKHQSGLVISTRNRLPLVLVYYEACRDKEDAKARERFLKSGMGERFLRTRMKNFLSQGL